jgi:hypothetical protein
MHARTISSHEKRVLRFLAALPVLPSRTPTPTIIAYFDSSRKGICLKVELYLLNPKNSLGSHLKKFSTRLDKWEKMVYNVGRSGKKWGKMGKEHMF